MNPLLEIKMSIGKASRRLKNRIKRKKVQQHHNHTKIDKIESDQEQNTSIQWTICPLFCNGGKVIEPVKK
jgi:hypothetical protein